MNPSLARKFPHLIIELPVPSNRPLTIRLVCFSLEHYKTKSHPPPPFLPLITSPSFFCLLSPSFPALVTRNSRDIESSPLSPVDPCLNSSPCLSQHHTSLRLASHVMFHTRIGLSISHHPRRSQMSILILVVILTGSLWLPIETPV